MKYFSTSAFPALVLLAVLGGSAPALAQQEQGRVISSTPVREANGNVSYSVIYEYAGRRYTMRTDSPPGKTIPVQVSPLGVTVNTPNTPNTSPDTAVPVYTPSDTAVPVYTPSAGAAPWQDVTPEPGVVAGTQAANIYPQPVYRAPVYAPVYVAPSYGYGYGYYPPVSFSLSLGYVYSRGGRRWR